MVQTEKTGGRIIAKYSTERTRVMETGKDPHGKSQHRFHLSVVTSTKTRPVTSVMLYLCDVIYI